MRRAAGSAAVVVAVAVIALANVPATGVDERLRAVGLGQGWGVFAPEPMVFHVKLEADVRYADGSSRVWRLPEPDPLLQERSYRWQQWARSVMRDDRSELWEPAARWIARDSAVPGRRAVQVTLRRRFAPVPSPGAVHAALRWSEFDFFTQDLP